MIRIPTPGQPWPSPDDDAAPAAPVALFQPDPAPDPDGETAHLQTQDAAKRIDVGLASLVDQALRGGDQAFLATSGDAAAQAAAPLLARLREAAEQAVAAAPPAVAAMVTPVLRQRLQGVASEVDGHVQAQAQAAAVAVSDQRRDLSINAAARLMPHDPMAARAALDVARAETMRTGERLGLPPEQIQARLGQVADRAVTQAVTSRLASNPQAALGLLDTHRDQLSPSTLALLEPQVRAEAARAAARAEVTALIERHYPAPNPALAAVLPIDSLAPIDGPALAVHAAEAAGLDPARQGDAVAEALAQAAAINLRRAAAARELTAQVQGHMAQAQAFTLSDLPDPLRLAMPAATRQAAQAFAEAGGFATFTDPAAHGDLYARLASDPSGFASLDLTSAAPLFERTDFAALIADQRTLREGGPKAQALVRTLADARSILDQTLADAGVSPQDAPEAAAAFSDLKRAIDADPAAAAGQPPDPARLRQIADDRAAAQPRLWLAGYDRPPGNVAVNHYYGEDGGVEEESSQLGTGVRSERQQSNLSASQVRDIIGQAKNAGGGRLGAFANPTDGPDATQLSINGQPFRASQARNLIETFGPYVGEETIRLPLYVALLKSQAGSIGPKQTEKLASVAAEIWRAAEKHGYPPLEAVITAYYESTLNPFAKNGLYQWTNPRWRELGGDPAKEHDIDAQVAMLAKIEGGAARDKLTADIGSSVAWAVYLKHQQGPTGVRLLMNADPAESAIKVLSKAYLPKKNGKGPTDKNQEARNEALAERKALRAIKANMPLIVFESAGRDPTVGEFLDAVRAQWALSEQKVREFLALKGVQVP